MIPTWERVQTGRRMWHVRFRAGNGETVVHGENLTSKASCNTAIESVAAAHSPIGMATIVPFDRPAVVGRDVVLVHQGTPFAVRVRIIDVDNRSHRWLGRRRG